MTVFLYLAGFGVCLGLHHSDGTKSRDPELPLHEVILKAPMDPRRFLYQDELFPGYGLELIAVQDFTSTKAGKVLS
jgi:hypothetical protein